MTINTSKQRRLEQKASRTSHSAGEKRVFSRVECLMDLEVNGDSFESEEVEALDLSLLGLGFERDPVKDPLPLGQVLDIGIHGFAPLQAKVRWIEGSRVGVQFCGRLSEIVESWVGEVMSAQGVRVKDLFEATRL